ncbi:50S ribosomal protein L7ae-like protein [Bacillus sp. B15-48]|uniref:50S ribosomal protein L7ae-like protein n=1 Tax=Bacillus sp. B15-48 TaxID=1548601 RepID=UPI00193FFF74|nr:50S ribosomal protein L7ae-like protein [Bacillus sp. B15-48]MBM4764947.1 50S ribosomal protein L7ae-like protein [Bacillus sp. B15-48]
MSYEKVLQAKKITIGTKQTVKALSTNSVLEVIIAEDADQNLKELIIDQTLKTGVKVSYVDSMKKLGNACGINVKAAAVAILM